MNKITKKTVVISAWLPGGGIEKVIQNLYLQESPYKDLDVLVLSTKVNYNWYGKFENKIHFYDCFSQDSNLIRTFFSFFKSLQVVNKYIKNESPEYILFSHSFLLPIFGILKPNCQVFYWPQNSLKDNTTLIRNVLTKLNYLVFNKSIKGVLCVNETIEKEANDLGFNNTHLIFNPIGESFPNQFMYDPNSNKLVHIGFLDNRKNTSFILKAFAKTKNQNLLLDIIGDGELLNSLIQEANELGISQKVNFRGFVNLKNEIIQCSGLIMSSKSEGFSMIISDALKCGIPVILPESLDICRFIKSNKNLGVEFSLNNVSSLSTVLDTIDFKTYNSNFISESYKREYGEIAYSKRLIKAFL